MSAQTMSLGLGLANAGYAVGTVLAVQLAQLLPQRRMMVLYAALLVIGSVLAAAAQDPAGASASRSHAAPSTPMRSISVMVNEEDHLRIQALSAGWSMPTCDTLARAYLDAFAARLNFV